MQDLGHGLDDMTLKGEIVVCIARGDATADPAEIEQALRRALEAHSVKEAAKLVADTFEVPRREMYQRALKIRDED